MGGAHGASARLLGCALVTGFSSQGANVGLSLGATSRFDDGLSYIVGVSF